MSHLKKTKNDRFNSAVLLLHAQLYVLLYEREWRNLVSGVDTVARVEAG